MTVADRRWVQRPAPPAGLAEDWGLDPLLCRLLHNRGVASAAEAAAFLAGDDSLTHDPRRLPDAEPALDRLVHAVVFGDAVAVYGDYDADGLTATALMVEGLRVLGAQVVAHYIPHRLEEGYGLHLPALRWLRQQGAQLLVTVDCGSGAQEQADYARDLGLDVIVTDHHRVEQPLDGVRAEVNPRRPDSVYPFRDLAGVGIAFKLIQALATAVGRENELEGDRWLDLVALGTVADMAPLLDENRHLVKRGLAALNSTSRPGLQAMLERAGLRPGSVSAGSIAFNLAPRLNAAGRLDNAQASFQLLATTSRAEASDLASLLEERNAERQRLQDAVLARARERALEAGDDPFLVLGDESFPLGVAGLVAGKLAEELGRPALVLETGKEEIRGSARSVAGFDVYRALYDCRDLLIRFGGHSQAAGLTLPVANLEELRRRLVAIARSELAGRDRRPRLEIDAELPLSSLERVSPLVDLLAPFGIGNPVPTFLTRNVRVRDRQLVKEKHLRLGLVDDRGGRWKAMGFHLAELGDRLNDRIDVVYRLDLHEWAGQQTLRLSLQDLRAASLSDTVEEP